MTTESELSGVDLARQALLATREASRKSGATRQKPKRRTTTAVRRDGREPLGLDSAISMMMTERGMTVPAAGGSVLADFDTILTAVVPELTGRVQAVAFNAETGPPGRRPRPSGSRDAAALERPLPPGPARGERSALGTPPDDHGPRRTGCAVRTAPTAVTKSPVAWTARSRGSWSAAVPALTVCRTQPAPRAAPPRRVLAAGAASHWGRRR
ncbi:hypothetical protein ACFUEM_32665 [Streptomyces anulatus]|uniref:hypothetical protein n=1 Tax=Streptomyces anulatus TaxID=1892 RepID=UPI0035DFF88C